MTSPTLLDLPDAKGGLLVVALLAIGGFLVWLLERWLDVRDNRRALRRRQIARHVPDAERASDWQARGRVNAGKVGTYPTFNKVHERAEERQS